MELFKLVKDITDGNFINSLDILKKEINTTTDLNYNYDEYSEYILNRIKKTHYKIVDNFDINTLMRFTNSRTIFQMAILANINFHLKKILLYFFKSCDKCDTSLYRICIPFNVNEQLLNCFNCQCICYFDNNNPNYLVKREKISDIGYYVKNCEDTIKEANSIIVVNNVAYTYLQISCYNNDIEKFKHYVANGGYIDIVNTYGHNILDLVTDIMFLKYFEEMDYIRLLKDTDLAHNLHKSKKIINLLIAKYGISIKDVNKDYSYEINKAIDYESIYGLKLFLKSDIYFKFDNILKMYLSCNDDIINLIKKYDNKLKYDEEEICAEVIFCANIKQLLKLNKIFNLDNYFSHSLLEDLILEYYENESSSDSDRDKMLYIMKQCNFQDMYIELLISIFPNAEKDIDLFEILMHKAYFSVSILEFIVHFFNNQPDFCIFLIKNILCGKYENIDIIRQEKYIPEIITYLNSVFSDELAEYINELLNFFGQYGDNVTIKTKKAKALIY